MKAHLCFSLLLAATMVCGCGGSQTTTAVGYSERAEGAFAEAEEALDGGNYAYALNLYRAVRDNFSMSPYATLAELRIADVHFEQGTYLLAAEAYHQFIQLHPSHAAVPYARFRIGMSYFEDMPSDFFLLPPPYERELGSTRSANRTLGEFLERYGASEDPEIQGYTTMAEEAYNEATERLASFEFYVATFYLERERPLAAADHFRDLLEEHSSTSFAPGALFLLARCYVEVSDVATALETILELQRQYPDHDLTETALAWMDRHGLAFSDIPSGD